MNFEELYLKLPGFIKYSTLALKSSLGISKKLRELNITKSDEIPTSEFKVSDTLRNVQLLNLELLRFIDNVCNKYDIDYWITGGTLLGAVRHGGFIPWDDDVDITFMRKDYERFIEIIPKEISKYDYFKENGGLTLLRDNHENYFKDFNSVYDFEGDSEVLTFEKVLFLQIAWLKPFIKIDCFPEDYVRDEKIDNFKKKYLITKYRFNDEIKLGKKSFDEEFKIQSRKIGFTDVESEYFNDSLDTINIYPISLRKTDEVFPLSTIEFENCPVKCPKNNDYYLKRLFGDNYMQWPEMIHNHSVSDFILSQFNSKEEMDEKFRNDIAYLKEINDNY